MVSHIIGLKREPLSGHARRFELRGPTGPPAGPMTLVVAVAVVAALYFGRDLLVPLALAVLLSFALGPLVMLLRRWHFGRVPSVITTVLLAFLLIFGIGTLFASQLTQLAERLPDYEDNITYKVQSIRDMTTERGILGRASEVLKDLGNEIDKATNATAASSRPGVHRLAKANGAQPVLVEVRPPDATPLQIVQDVVSPMFEPLATVGIVVVFVVLFLLQREDLRNRFIRLAGSGDLRRTTEALNDAVGRLSRYLLMQTAINSVFGLLIGGGLWLIGTPNPLLWGVLAMLLRFVPYMGPVIAALFPVALALAVDPGWAMLLKTVALFLIVEPVMGQIVEPVVYGHSTGLSAVAIVVSAAFWTWLWGPIGLFLSTPLTLCLVVLGRHVGHLEFFDILLGDEPALSLEENFYQRMLAGDPDEAARQAEEVIKEKSLTAYYDEVAIRGLVLARRDSNRGELSHERRVQIKETADGLIDNLSDHAVLRGDREENDRAERSIRGRARDAVLCVAGRGSLDEASAAMLGQLLAREGIGARIVPTAEVSGTNIHRFAPDEWRIACLCYLDAGDFTNARYLVRRLRRKLPGVKIIIGFWALNAQDESLSDALRETEANHIVTSLHDATDLIWGYATEAAASLPRPGTEIAAAQ